MFKKTRLIGLFLAAMLGGQASGDHLTDRIKIKTSFRHPEDFQRLKFKPFDQQSETIKAKKEFAKLCPTYKESDFSEQFFSKWLTLNFTADDVEQAPKEFQDLAFKLVSNQPASAEKIQSLGLLLSQIQFDPAFIVWMDAGKMRFNQSLRDNQFLNAEKQDWPNVIKDEARLKIYLDTVGNLFVQSFFPQSKLPPLPEAVFFTDPTGMSGQLDGTRIRFNLARIRTKTSPVYADNLAAHENFHFVEGMITGWFISKNRISNHALKDAGEKFLYTFQGGYVPMNQNVSIYRQTFSERASYYIEDAANSPDKMILLSKDNFWLKKTAISFHKFNNHKEGKIPLACSI